MYNCRVHFFVLANHARFGHTREAGVFDCQADSKADALTLCQRHCNERFERVKEKDFKPDKREGKHSYKHKDEFEVLILSKVENEDE